MIKKISTSETFSVRHLVLRVGKPLESCHFDGDALPTTQHFGCFDKENLIGVVTLMKTKSTAFIQENQYQIRGMAVLKTHRKLNYGKKLLEKCEQFVLENKGDLIWFNARKSAVLFYKKSKYQPVEPVFEIESIGLHYLMFKTF